MPSWLTFGSWGILSIAVLLIALGFGLTLVYDVFRGILACLRLTPWLMSWTWAKVTGKPLSSHGTAHWGTMAEIAAAGLLNDTGIALAQLPKGQILREPLGQHIGLCAPPRSHKSWGMMRPAIQEFPGSVVASDPRGDKPRQNIVYVSGE